jgi:hypothetical protein
LGWPTIPIKIANKKKTWQTTIGGLF